MRETFSKFKVALALGVIAIFLTATAFARAGKQDFILHNQTGVEIHEVEFDHLQILREPFVTVLGQKLAKCLQRVSQRVQASSQSVPAAAATLSSAAPDHA